MALEEAQEAWTQARAHMPSPAAMQLEEASERMAQIKGILPAPPRVNTQIAGRLDRVLTHPVWGVLGFGLVFS